MRTNTLWCVYDLTYLVEIWVTKRGGYGRHNKLKMIEDGDSAKRQGSNVSTTSITGVSYDHEYPQAVKLNGKYIIPWKTKDHPPNGLKNMSYFLTWDRANVPNENILNQEPLMELMQPNPKRIAYSPKNGIRVTWLGHTTVLCQLDDINILINPKFTQRCGKYYHPGSQTRYRAAVYRIADLPRIDCVLITNTHFDYLDLPSVRELNAKYGDGIVWYVPAGVTGWMHKAGCVNVVEKVWWKEDELMFVDQYGSESDDDESKNKTILKIVCTPSQNFHSRSLNDENCALWCSWVLISPGYRVFVSGATGYNDVIFKAIGEKYGPFHLAVLPIGGYEPRWKFSFGNVTPEQAVQIHEDISAEYSLGVSWGTFTVSNEYYLEPPHRLSEERKKRGLSETTFFVLKHGESRLLKIGRTEKKLLKGSSVVEDNTNDDLSCAIQVVKDDKDKDDAKAETKADWSTPQDKHDKTGYVTDIDDIDDVWSTITQDQDEDDKNKIVVEGDSNADESSNEKDDKNKVVVEGDSNADESSTHEDKDNIVNKDNHGGSITIETSKSLDVDGKAVHKSKQEVIVDGCGGYY